MFGYKYVIINERDISIHDTVKTNCFGRKETEWNNSLTPNQAHSLDWHPEALTNSFNNIMPKTNFSGDPLLDY